MMFVKAALSVLLALVFFFGFGSFFLSRSLAILSQGQLTYSRRGHATVSVSPELHPFSYFYQVAFHGSLAGFFLLLGTAFCMYGVAKLLRMSRSHQNPIADGIYRSATTAAWVGISFGVVWFVLRVLRGVVIQ